MYGVEATGKGLETGLHSAPLAAGRPGVLHGNRTYLMENEDGQIIHTHSISAGLDYPGVGPAHAWLKDIGRVNSVGATDEAAVNAFHTLTPVEGIMPPLQSSHAVTYAIELAATVTREHSAIVSLSGRADNAVFRVAA